MTVEIPAQMADEALFLNWAVAGNLASWDEVTSWADGWIERLDKWPEQITEISLNSHRKDSAARSALAELALASSGHHFPQQLIERALNRLKAGRNPFQLISELYSLVYEKIEVGDLTLSITLPEVLRTAIYQLDYDAESVSPNFGWSENKGKKAEAWLRARIQDELQQVLTATKPITA